MIVISLTRGKGGWTTLEIFCSRNIKCEILKPESGRLTFLNWHFHRRLCRALRLLIVKCLLSNGLAFGQTAPNSLLDVKIVIEIKPLQTYFSKMNPDEDRMSLSKVTFIKDKIEMPHSLISFYLDTSLMTEHDIVVLVFSCPEQLNRTHCPSVCYH